MMLTISVLLCALAAAAGYNFCINDLGCFPTGDPYAGNQIRPFELLPFPCHVSCFLITSNNLKDPQEICNDPAAIGSSCFDENLDTYIIIHGYTQSSREPWMRHMAETIITDKPANCILIDWGSASWDVYIRAIQTIRTVGKKVANMMDQLQQVKSYDLARVNMIGHSLGGHICSYVGKFIGCIGSIVALDPAGPLFEGVAAQIRLNKGDAKFVQVIHTNAGSLADLALGYVQPLGHFDVYVNGGSKMPECPAPPMSLQEGFCLLSPLFGPIACEDLGFPTPAQCSQILGHLNITQEEFRVGSYALFCDHYMSISYYIDSILYPERYCAQPCETLENCQQGQILLDQSEECSVMGHHARPPTNNHNLFHLHVTAVPLTP